MFGPVIQYAVYRDSIPRMMLAVALSSIQDVIVQVQVQWYNVVKS